MREFMDLLAQRTGTFRGNGVNHEGQDFVGTLRLLPQFDGKGFTLDFTAKGENGQVFHKEHSLLGVSASGAMALWVLSDNHPGITEHRLIPTDGPAGSLKSLAFLCGDLQDTTKFREVITLDLWPDGDVSYRYAWGMPGGEFGERSSARLQNGKQRAVPEAKLVRGPTGLKPQGEGWYVINAADAVWSSSEKFGAACTFEGNVDFDHYGINIRLLQPGQPNCHYHGEDDQEDFLVLQGECRLLIEGEERLLKAWDFVHCPKWARHVFVGAGTAPCAILMVGSRTGRDVIYPTPEIAKKYSACPAEETDSPKLSYAGCPRPTEIASPWRP